MCNVQKKCLIRTGIIIPVTKTKTRNDQNQKDEYPCHYVDASHIIMNMLKLIGTPSVATHVVFSSSTMKRSISIDVAEEDSEEG